MFGLEGPSSRMLDDRNPATGSGEGLVKCVVEWHGWYEIIENMAWMATRMSAWLPMNRSESAGYPKNPARKNRIEKCGDRPTSSSLCVELVFLALLDCKCNKINHSQESNRSSMKMNGRTDCNEGQRLRKSPRPLKLHAYTGTYVPTIEHRLEE